MNLFICSSFVSAVKAFYKKAVLVNIPFKFNLEIKVVTIVIHSNSVTKNELHCARP